jgi:hypothetical protein
MLRYLFHLGRSANFLPPPALLHLERYGVQRSGGFVRISLKVKKSKGLVRRVAYPRSNLIGGMFSTFRNYFALTVVRQYA